jgi:hypothetical protein
MLDTIKGPAAQSQHITRPSAYEWHMYAPRHQLSWNCDDGSASFEIRKYPSGSLSIVATETGKITKAAYVSLQPDSASSLFEFLSEGWNQTNSDALTRAFERASEADRIAFVRAVGAEAVWNSLQAAI